MRIIDFECFDNNNVNQINSLVNVNIAVFNANGILKISFLKLSVTISFKLQNFDIIWLCIVKENMKVF